MEKEQPDTKKISAGKKNNKIILNPPEKPPIKNVNERFKDALPKHTVVIEKKIELVLQAKANTAEFPEEALRQVFVRGYKSLPLNSELTREQYAMNRVNSFIAGGSAMLEDYDLLPIEEKFARLGMKGTGGARRPHIKREKSPYNNKTVFHVVDAKGVVKHSTSDEGEAKQHLATKYNTYMEMTEGLKQTLRKVVPGYAKREIDKKMDAGKFGKTDADKDANFYRYKKIQDKIKKEGVAEEKMKGEDPCWKGYHMVGKKIKAGREVPNCVPKNEEVQPVNEISKELANRYYWSAKSSGDEMDKKISSKVKKLGDKWSQRTHNNLTDLLAKSQKRTAGRLRALDRLNKEEVENISEMDKSQTPPGRDGGTKSSGPDRTAKPLKAKQMMDKAHKVVMKSMSNADKVKNGWRNPNMSEATSAAIRMQRALDKIKADRERRERLAAPFVNSVFGKKDEKKPEPKKD